MLPKAEVRLLDEAVMHRIRNTNDVTLYCQLSMIEWDDADWQAPLWPIMLDTALSIPRPVRGLHL